MDKICVEVLVPIIGKKFELLIPSTMKIGIAKRLIAQIIDEHEVGIGLDIDYLVLCSKTNEAILNENITVEAADLRDGSELILV